MRRAAGLLLLSVILVGCGLTGGSLTAGFLARQHARVQNTAEDAHGLRKVSELRLSALIARKA